MRVVVSVGRASARIFSQHVRVAPSAGMASGGGEQEVPMSGNNEGPHEPPISAYYRGVLRRGSVVVVALAVAWLVPVEWHWKFFIYAGIMIVAVLVASFSTWGRRISK
jgi:hypothetical protein